MKHSELYCNIEYYTLRIANRKVQFKLADIRVDGTDCVFTGAGDCG